jgi:DNA-binding MarR family transcriptional regulator
MCGKAGSGTRAALAYLLRQGLDQWVTSTELAAALDVPPTLITARLKVCRRDGLVVVRKINGNGRGWLQWQITPAGAQALAAADAAEAAVQSGAVWRRRNRYRPAARVSTVRDQLLQVLQAAPAGVWMLSAELIDAAGITCRRLSMGAVFRHVLAAMVVERSYASDRKALWRLVRPDVPAAEACHARLDGVAASVLESADDMAERARQAERYARWRPLPGSLAARALDQLGRQPRGQHVEPAPLADWIGSDMVSVIEALQPAVLAGLVDQLPSPRDVRRPVFRLADRVAA